MTNKKKKMMIEIVISILVGGFTCLGLIVYSNWKKLQMQEKELEEITSIVVIIIDELTTEIREQFNF